MKLALGTAQFGADYGVANTAGRPTADVAAAIVHRARGAGLGLIDTAMEYGDCEERLGAIGISQWRVVSKLPALPTGEHDVAAWTLASVRRSLSRLRVSSLYGLLLHRPAQLLDSRGSALYAALQSAQAEGLVEKIGISIYDPSELELLCARFDFSLVQAPVNLLDRRMVDSGWLTRLTNLGIEVHARSVFLQGLLLMPSGHRPTEFARWDPLWARFDDWLAVNQLTPLQACLGWPLSFGEIAKAVVGVDSVTQLDAILAAANVPAVDLPDWLRSGDPDLINPSRWRLLPPRTMR